MPGRCLGSTIAAADAELLVMRNSFGWCVGMILAIDAPLHRQTVRGVRAAVRSFNDRQLTLVLVVATMVSTPYPDMVASARAVPVSKYFGFTALHARLQNIGT